MAGTSMTQALTAATPPTQVWRFPAGTPLRLITPAASTAKLQISEDGWNWRDWSFGVQPQSTTNEERLLNAASVKAVPVTGTATLEVDLPAAVPSMIAVKGSPATKVAAPAGTVAIRTDGGDNTVVYAKESGTDATGWGAATFA